MIENRFDPVFTSELALKEKQIQQSYRPLIGVHKWFARRPGSVFRNLIISEFAEGKQCLEELYFGSNSFDGVIADPFMGGGTPIYEANRVGLNTIGADINPMAYWVVKQTLNPLDLVEFDKTAQQVISNVQDKVGHLYETKCPKTGKIERVKYFLWVKVSDCPECSHENDLFPGYLLAQNVRHPKNVIVCSSCGHLNEHEKVPKGDKFENCESCSEKINVDRKIGKGRLNCTNCNHEYKYSGKHIEKPFRHRLFAIEYSPSEKPEGHKGRFFKKPDKQDLKKAAQLLGSINKGYIDLLPESEIPLGDETKRLFNWGYKNFSDLFNGRQKTVLPILLREVLDVEDTSIREALLTVFSDFLRYQNMLCRYDTYALKCQDIFSVHGFPVGLIKCENNVLGIPKVGSGSFVHFVEKYKKAKTYTQQPFETSWVTGKKKIVPILDETVSAKVKKNVTKGSDSSGDKWSLLRAAPSWSVDIEENSIDGVFTDPPYFNNVQYSELMDFCYTWLRQGLKETHKEFRSELTTSSHELTGNKAQGRDLEHFTSGISKVFSHYAKGLKDGGPFVFTYHHNEPSAYAPLIVGILDAGLSCTATLPVVGEMSASIHIAGTSSSTLDTVFVCRKIAKSKVKKDSVTMAKHFPADLTRDASMMRAAGVKVTAGDLRCLASGHIARYSIKMLQSIWDSSESTQKKMKLAIRVLNEISETVSYQKCIEQNLKKKGKENEATL